MSSPTPNLLNDGGGHRRDYGPKGCCGPKALGGLIVSVAASIVGLRALIRKAR